MSMRTLSLVLLLLPALTQAGTILETLHRNVPANDDQKLTRTFAQDGRMRVESGGNSLVIFKDDAMYALNTRDRTYRVMDRETMKKMADAISPALRQLQDRLAKMPPEQRAQMERMLGSRMSGAPRGEAEFRKTTRSDKVAGYACSYTEVYEQGALQDELCIVPAGTLKGGEELMAAGQKVSELMEEILSNVDAPWLKDSVERQIQNYARLGGIPVLTRHFVDGKPASETIVQTVRTESLPAATFEVPAGYTLKEPLRSR
jgi:hypothetical protein